MGPELFFIGTRRRWFLLPHSRLRDEYTDIRDRRWYRGAGCLGWSSDVRLRVLPITAVQAMAAATAIRCWVVTLATASSNDALYYTVVGYGKSCTITATVNNSSVTNLAVAAVEVNNVDQTAPIYPGNYALSNHVDKPGSSTNAVTFRGFGGPDESAKCTGNGDVSWRAFGPGNDIRWNRLRFAKRRLEQFSKHGLRHRAD